MAANWGVNAVLGLTAFLLTYAFTLVNNTWQTSLLRAGLGFVLFFLLGYILRFFLHQLSVKNGTNQFVRQNFPVDNNTDSVPNTQEDRSMADSLFQAIPLQSLHNGEDEKNPEIIAQTIQTWTKQNKEE